MKLILISGKAGHGKDTLARYMKEILVSKNKNVLVTHYGDLLKYICKQLFGWDGNKDEKGRTLLQYVGTDVIRKQKPDYWVQFVADMLAFFPNEWDYVIIPDVRFPNEIEGLAGFNPYHIRIVRPGFNMLTEEQQKHPSETALDDYKNVSLYVNNQGTLVDLLRKAEVICSELDEGFGVHHII
jgi:hypothetical protein